MGLGIGAGDFPQVRHTRSWKDVILFMHAWKIGDDGGSARTSLPCCFVMCDPFCRVRIGRPWWLCFAVSDDPRPARGLPETGGHFVGLGWEELESLTFPDLHRSTAHWDLWSRCTCGAAHKTGPVCARVCPFGNTLRTALFCSLHFCLLTL